MKKAEYQLIELCKQNDTQAKEWLYKTYAPVLLGVCLRYIKNRMQAEDVLQESFITVFDKIHQLKSNEAFEGWMKRIVVNNSLQFLKAQKHHKNVDELNDSLTDTEKEEEPKNVKEQILQLELSQEKMLSLISELPTGFKTVFNLYVFEKFKHSEIAKQLGISEGTSKSQLLRARKLLQKNLHALVLEKQKSKKREKVYLSSFILVMDNDLGYIDKLVQSKLEGLSVPPISGTEFISSAASVQTSTAAIGGQSKLIALLSKKAIWLSSTVLVGAGLTAVLLTSQPKEPTVIKYNAPILVVSDSVENIVPSLTIQPKIEHNQVIETVPEKAIVKKAIVVKVPKKITVTETKKVQKTINVTKTDTISVKQ